VRRKIIQIDRDKCNCCGLCIDACHEGALQLVDGKAQLISDVYCDGLGACLPKCPVDAIAIVDRDAAVFDEAAVQAAQQHQHSSRSELRQWPCQIRLVPVNAQYFQGADLLVAADCTAFASATVHRDFMAGRISLIGCPKLDDVDYAEKLGAILQANDIRSLTVLRMEVPCCGGLADAVRRAVAASGKTIACRVVTIGTDGGVADH
jgi:ferredoxin